MVNKEIIEFKDYGKCIKLSNGIIEAIATLDLGPRIVSFGFIDDINILNTEKDKFEPINNADFDRHFYPGATWHNYGGHRLWASPEKTPDTYYPDCNPVVYEITDGGVILTPPPQHENGLAMKIELKMSNTKPDMEVIHSMTNISNDEKDLSLWALSVAAQGGTLIIPTNTNDTGLLPNRTMSIWAYTDMSDERIFYGEKYITVRQDPDAKTPMKLGFDLNNGEVYYLLNNTVFKTKYYPNHPNGRYPDGGVSMETYNCGLFLEIETLSEQKIMKSGATETHLEIWSLMKKPCELNAKSDSSIDYFISELK